METSLHRQLKEMYAAPGAQLEARLGAYRIDVLSDEAVIEIQHSGLAAIRDKVRQLVKTRKVVVVKPIVATKRIVKRNRKGGRVVDQRMSPKRGGVLDLFDELVHFTRAFPHRNLTLEAPLVDIEEWRYPGHGRRRRRRERDHVIEDQKLIEVRAVYRLQSAADLAALIDARLPRPFHTGHLAEALCVQRWIAQRIAYCLRKTGAAREVGKQGNALLYEFTAAKAA